MLLPDEDLHDEAVAALLGPGLLQQAALPPSLEGYLRSNLRGTWFTLDLEEASLQHTHSGTAPGSPLADLLFQFVQSRFMKQVSQDMAEAGLTVKVHVADDPVCPQGWADDVAVLLPLCQAEELISNIQKCLPILDERSRGMGVSLNYDAGETETLICLRGKGSVALRRQLLSPDQPTVPVVLPHGPCVHLRLVEKYLHLGNSVCTSASCDEDVKVKMQSADGVFRRLQSTLLRNPELLPPEKTLLVNSMILAKVRFGAGMWIPRSAAEVRHVHMALSKYWRMACRSISGHSSKHLDELDIATLLGALTADETLCVERCRQLCTVCDEGPGFLWRCLMSADAWLVAAACDLRIALTAVSCPITLPAASGTELLQLIKDNSVSIRRAIARYAQYCLQQRAHGRDAVVQKAQRLHDFEEAGGVLLPVPVVSQGHLACDFCSLRFATRANLAAHLSTVHGRKSAVNAASGSCCQVCQVEWWSTYRLREHLRRSPACLQVYDAADLDTSAAHETTGSRQQRAWRPPTQAFGPQPWWATLTPPAAAAAAAVTVPPSEAAEFQSLLDSYSKETLQEWAPRALHWMRLHSFDSSVVPPSHPACDVLLVLAGIVDQANVHEEGAKVLHSSGVKAHREGHLWWLSSG